MKTLSIAAAFFFAGIVPSLASAQEGETKTPAKTGGAGPAFHGYMEAGGRNILGSFNLEARYDRFLVQAGWGPGSVEEDEKDKYSIPLTAGFLLFHDPAEAKDHSLEIVAGATVGNFETRVYYTGCIGWRGRWADWVFRAGASPIYQPKNKGTESMVFVPWVYGSVGYQIDLSLD